MKNMKLFSTLALAAFAVNTLATTTGADTVEDKQTTDAKASFTLKQEPVDPNPQPEDPDDIVINPVLPGTLAFLGQPSMFDFGSTELTEDQTNDENFATTIDQVIDSNYPDAKQGVIVYDGRQVEEDWTMKVSASEFTDGASNTLTGASLVINNIDVSNIDVVGDIADLFDNALPTALNIDADGTEQTVLATKTGETARKQTHITWKKSDVSLNVAGKIVAGDYTSTVTWTLVGEADAAPIV